MSGECTLRCGMFRWGKARCWPQADLSSAFKHVKITLRKVLAGLRMFSSCSPAGLSSCSLMLYASTFSHLRQGGRVLSIRCKRRGDLQAASHFSFCLFSGKIIVLWDPFLFLHFQRLMTGWSTLNHTQPVPQPAGDSLHVCWWIKGAFSLWGERKCSSGESQHESWGYNSTSVSALTLTTLITKFLSVEARRM